MISSFWNICRACPSMPLGSAEKFHSEYRSTFQWYDPSRSHIEAAGSNPSTAIVLQQPALRQNRNLESTLTDKAGGEPPIPRRKKHPDFAYRTNEWITNSNNTSSSSGNKVSNNKEKLVAAEVKEKVVRPKKSISMNTIPGHVVPEHKLHPIIKQKKSGGLESFSVAESKEEGEFTKSLTLETTGTHHHQHHESEDEKRHEFDQGDFKNRKEYKSEYKERFRPFSQYEYVDGRFMNRKGDQEADRPWYAEVIELRKKAGEYKFRGWGTDLCSPTVHVFNQQLWEQVARRSSLAPLALITTTPRYDITKAEKDKENARKSFTAKGSFGRPHTATPKHPISDLEKYKGHKDADSVPHKKKLLDEAQATKKMFPKMKVRSQSAGPASRSPRKATKQPSTASSISEKDGVEVSAGWKVQDDAICADGRSKPQRHLRPTTLTTSPRPRASSGKRDREAIVRLANEQLFKNSADPSYGYKDYAPPIKSPPEPTRMKSPEQALVRSPDPVNWTVPLDTTKGFTVTQNIKEAPPSPRKLPGVGNDLKSQTKPAINGLEKKLKIKGVEKSRAQPQSGVKSVVTPPKKTAVDLKKKEESQKAATVIGDKKSGDSKPQSQSGGAVKCLEDPTFMFDTTKSKANSGPEPASHTSIKSQPKGVRVLEAPAELPSTLKSSEGVTFAPPPPVASPPLALGTSKVSETPPKSKKGISVLEAPSDSSSSSGHGKSGKSKASDVLEKARHKFDKFWGKSKDEEK